MLRLVTMGWLFALAVAAAWIGVLAPAPVTGPAEGGTRGVDTSISETLARVSRRHDIPGSHPAGAPGSCLPFLGIGPTFGPNQVEPDAAGEAVLSYESPSSRNLWVVLQFALWILVFVAATRLSTSLSRRRTVRIEDETLIHLEDQPIPPAPAPEPAPGLDPGLDITGEIARDSEANTVEPESPDEGPEEDR